MRTVQPHLEAHPQGHIGTHSASTGSIPPGHPRPGPGSPPWRGRRDGVGTRRRDARRLRRGIGSERRCLRGAPVPRSRPGTNSGSSRRPGCGSSHRLHPNRSDWPQSALRLLPWNHLEGHRSLGLAGMPPRLNAVLQNRAAPVVSQCPHFSQQHRAGLQTIPGVVVTNSVYGSASTCACSAALTYGTPGDLRACPCAGRDTCVSSCGICPTPGQSHGWNSPHPSSRKAVSWLHLSAGFAGHTPTQGSEKNALPVRWVKSIPAMEGHFADGVDRGHPWGDE